VRKRVALADRHVVCPQRPQRNHDAFGEAPVAFLKVDHTARDALR
jgi:hypothetical protein